MQSQVGQLSDKKILSNLIYECFLKANTFKFLAIEE